MNVTLTVPQLLKIVNLDEWDSELLVSLIKDGGITDCRVGSSYATLVGLKLVKKRLKKVWTTFEVNGMKPTPFVSELRKQPASNNSVGALFNKFYTIRFGKRYPQFSATEWSLLGKLGKYHDLTELEAMFELFLTKYSKALITVHEFFKVRCSLLREVQKEVENDTRKSRGNPEKDGGW